MGRCWTSLKGGNRGTLHRGVDDAQRYGDLIDHALAGDGDEVSHRCSAIAEMAKGTPIRPNLSPTLQAMKQRMLAKHKAGPYRHWPMTVAGVAAVGAGIHAATRGGGARIVCPRTRVSMMIIAAPQSGQT